MNPFKYAQMIKYLIRAKKQNPNLPDVFPASQAPIPPKKESIKTMEAVNRFVRDNPRTEKAGGGMLVQPGFGGTRQGYSGKMKYTKKEVQEIYKDLPENIYVQKRTLPTGRTDYTYRARIMYKGKEYTFPSKVATPENKKQLIKDVEAKWDELAPNRISRKEYAKLRLLPENRKLSGDEFAEKLNNVYKKVTYRGEKWNNQNVFNYDLSAPRSKKRIADDLGFFEKRTVAEAKKIINKYSGGKHFLKNKNLTDAQITTRASQYVAMEKRADKEGGKSWPRGRQNKRKVWTDIYKSYTQGGRFELVNKKELADADGTINWKKGSTYDNKKNPFEPSNANWRKAKFKDKKSGAIFTYDNLEKMVDKHGGGYQKAINAYNENAILNQTTFNGKSLNEIIREAMIKKDYEVLTGKKVRMDDPGLLEYMGKKKPSYSFTEAHHFKGVKNYPFDTEPSFRRANREQGIVQGVYDKAVASGNPERIAKAKNVYINKMNEISDKYGGIRFKMDDKRFIGRTATTESLVKTGLAETNLSKKSQADILKRMGFKCKYAKADGGRIALSVGTGRCDDPDSYTDDINKTRQDLKSDDVRVRAAAQAKLNKGLQVAKTLPTIGKFLRRAGQATVGAVSSTLKTLGLTTPVGYAIEGIVEGGIYDYFKKQGYTDQQALAETFTPGLISGRPEGVPWYGGAESLLEKELVGDEPGRQFQPKVAQYVDALKDQEQVFDAFGRLEQGQQASRKDIIDAARADIQDLNRSGTISRINRIMNPESMASQAYQTAVERQAGAQDQRARDYMAENYVQTEPTDFAEQQLQKKRNEAMLQMFPSPTVEDVQNVYKAAGRGDDLKYFEAQDYKDFMKDMDDFQKQSYFADNFRLEKAGGGIAKLAGVSSGPPPESGPNSQGLQGLMKRVRNL